MTDTLYIWVRYRRKSSAGHGEWQWREYAFPSTCRTKKTQMFYFAAEYASDLCDEYNSYSEHYRGVDYDILPVPRHIVEAKLKGLHDSYRRIEDNINRLQDLIDRLPVVDIDAKTKKPCREWPKCGCLKQGRTPDCRLPHDLLMAKLRAKNTARLGDSK